MKSSLKDATQGDARPSYLINKRHQEKSVLGWWYELASPKEPEYDALFPVMERFRRGRIGSQLILTLYIVLLIMVIPAVSNKYLIPIVAGTAVALVIATLFNRKGMVTTAAILVVVTFVLFPVATILATPDGLSMLILPLFGLLILPVLCAALFLPQAQWVFLVALGNTFFTFFALNFLPRTAELSSVLTIAFAGIVIPIVLGQLLVSIGIFVSVQGARLAQQWADQANELAKIEHAFAKEGEVAAQKKEVLVKSLKIIQKALLEVANKDDYTVRIPQLPESELWSHAGLINNLLATAQRSRGEISRLNQVQESLRVAQERNATLVGLLKRNGIPIK